MRRKRFEKGGRFCREVFADWEILIDEVRPCSDGRPLSFFAARKPSYETAPRTVETAGDAGDDGVTAGVAATVGNKVASSKQQQQRKRKKPDQAKAEMIKQRQAQAATLPGRFAEFYRGIGLTSSDEWPSFERCLLSPHHGLCFRICGGMSAAAATKKELMASFGNLVKENGGDGGAALLPLRWVGDGGRSWALRATRAELRSEPQLAKLREWVTRRQRTGQVRREEIADMLPVSLLLLNSGRGRHDQQQGIKGAERVLDLCSAPAHLAPGVATGRLLDCLWGGGDGTTTDKLLVANDAELARCWMVLQDAGLPEGRRTLTSLVVSACDPESYPCHHSSPADDGGIEWQYLLRPILV
jgi:hypothetical protein